MSVSPKKQKEYLVAETNMDVVNEMLWLIPAWLRDKCNFSLVLYIICIKSLNCGVLFICSNTKYTK